MPGITGVCQPEPPDAVEEQVRAAICAVQSGNRADIESAYRLLAPLETADVIAELFVWVEDLTRGVNQSDLLQAARLPVPPRSTDILQAVAGRDLLALQAAVGSDRLDRVLASLFVLIAALRDARTRL